MFRDILSNKGVLAALLFCVLIVAGSQLYSWHVKRGIQADEARTQQFLQQLETQKKTHAVQDTGALIDTQTLGQTQTHLETDASQMSEETAVVRDEASERLDTAEAFLPDEITEEDTTAVPVSPYGFGPYPALPQGWPADIWPCISANHELMARVGIKLVSQGIDVRGSIMEGGLVYPTVPGTVYVKWAETKGIRYIADLAGDPDACDRIRAIEDERKHVFSELDIPSDIKVLSFEEGGIDPYTFLDLP